MSLSLTTLIPADALDVLGLLPHATQSVTAAFEKGGAEILAGDSQALELAMAEQQCLDLKDPTPKHTLESLTCAFSGMIVVSYMYAAFQQFISDVDVGIGLSKEYEAVKGK